MNKKLLFVLFAAAPVLGGMAEAAIDDSGMKYVSAAEGLSGSIRVRLFEDSSERNDEAEVSFGETRIVYRGDSEMGSEMVATYFIEFRPADPSLDADREQDAGNFDVEYLDVGLKGRFGHFRVGSIESASSAIVPSPDRTNDVGDDGEKLADDYHDGGIRWVSPNIRGLVLGASAALADNPTRTKERGDKTVDQYDLAVSYSVPAGFGIGASYSVKAVQRTDRDDEKGFRLGAVYERSNWGFGYNFHNYSGSSPKGFFQGEAVAGLTSPFGQAGAKSADTLRGVESTEYREHVIGANFGLGKFNFGFNYSKANVKNDEADINETRGGVQGVDVDFTRIAVDAAYRLSSKTSVIAAYVGDQVKGEELVFDPLAGDFANKFAERNGSFRRYYLLTRIDF